LQEMTKISFLKS